MPESTTKKYAENDGGYFQWQEITQEAANYKNQFHFPRKKFHMESQTQKLQTGIKANRKQLRKKLQRDGEEWATPSLTL